MKARQLDINFIIAIACFGIFCFLGGFFVGGDSVRSARFTYTLFQTYGNELKEIPFKQISSIPTTFCSVPTAGTVEHLPNGSDVEFVGGVTLDVSNDHGSWRFCAGVPVDRPAPPKPKDATPGI